MIVMMKKVTVAGPVSHTDDVLERLREAGVLHIAPFRPTEGPVLDTMADKMFLAQTALLRIPEKPDVEITAANVESIITNAVRLSERLEECENMLVQLRAEYDRVAFLGPFDPRDLEMLRKRGIYIRLAELPGGKMKKIPRDFHCTVVGVSPSKAVIGAVVDWPVKAALHLPEFAIPSRSIVQLESEIERYGSVCISIREELGKYAPWRWSIENYLRNLGAAFELEKVRAGMSSAENIVFVRGYCPVDKVDHLRERARENGWGLLIDEPEKGEQPPTLTRNPRWVRIVDPVFRLLRTIPGYHELDISAWFLVFFSIFFGMIIGDAGYGMLILLTLIITRQTLPPKMINNRFFSLMTVLGLSTVVWGAITGNWFGIETLTTVEPFRNFIVPGWNAYTQEAQDRVMNLCFYIAAIHLTIAHFLVVTRDTRLTNAIANAGWILMVWVMFFIARDQVLGRPLPPFFTWMVVAAFVLIVPFSLLRRDPGKGIAEKLIADILLSTINTFSDTISYIRLFAVGLATLAVAQSFNSIALTVGFNSILAGFVSVLILVCGHGLNIALSAMAVIVHGIRLNMLEFSSHVGNTWSGYEYDPFRRRTSGSGKEKGKGKGKG